MVIPSTRWKIVRLADSFAWHRRTELSLSASLLYLQQTGFLSSGPTGETEHIFTVTLSAAGRPDASAFASVVSTASAVPTVKIASASLGVVDPAGVFSLSAAVDGAGPSAQPFSVNWTQISGPPLLSLTTLRPNTTTGQLVLLPGSLQPGAAYTLRASAPATPEAAAARRSLATAPEAPVGYAEYSFVAAAPPAGSAVAAPPTVSQPPPAAAVPPKVAGSPPGRTPPGGSSGSGARAFATSKGSRSAGWLRVSGPAPDAVAFSGSPNGSAAAAAAAGPFTASTGGWLAGASGLSFSFSYVVPAAGVADSPEGVISPFSPFSSTRDPFYLPPGDPSTGYQVTVRARALSRGESDLPSEPAEVNVTVLPGWLRLLGGGADGAPGAGADSTPACADWADVRTELLGSMAAATDSAALLAGLGRPHAVLAVSRVVLDTLQAFANSAPPDSACPGLVRGYDGFRRASAQAVTSSAAAGARPGEVQQVTALLSGLAQPAAGASDPGVLTSAVSLLSTAAADLRGQPPLPADTATDILDAIGALGAAAEAAAMPEAASDILGLLDSVVENLKGYLVVPGQDPVLFTSGPIQLALQLEPPGGASRLASNGIGNPASPSAFEALPAEALGGSGPITAVFVSTGCAGPRRFLT